MDCWMCERPDFRSVCPHHPTGVRLGVPLVDPRPLVRPPPRDRN